MICHLDARILWLGLQQHQHLLLTEEIENKYTTIGWIAESDSKFATTLVCLNHQHGIIFQSQAKQLQGPLQHWIGIREGFQLGEYIASLCPPYCRKNSFDFVLCIINSSNPWCVLFCNQGFSVLSWHLVSEPCKPPFVLTVFLCPGWVEGTRRCGTHQKVKLLHSVQVCSQIERTTLVSRAKVEST